MSKTEMHNAETATLANLFQLDAERTALWHNDELGAIFQHQLAAPLEPELSDFDAVATEKVIQQQTGSNAMPQTFAQLLHKVNPPLELLELTKRFAKECGTSADEPLPKDVSAVLYVCAIAAAMLRCDQRITEWDDSALQKKLEWAISQSWTDDHTRALLRASVDCLGSTAD